MPAIAELLKNIQETTAGVTLAELLAQHPDVARRTAQRWISHLVDAGQAIAIGKGRARRYLAAKTAIITAASATEPDIFPAYIPLSADSRDILAYVDQPLGARKPVGYQRDFLDTYRPNVTGYLSESLRRQLHKMGKTTAADAPAGTYGHAILGRLLIACRGHRVIWKATPIPGSTPVS